MASTELGEFLRARRAAASPDSVPFASAGPRRVPGLRRDEVAMLADVSHDYYRRLEQGRERHPSQPVLEGLSKALNLTSEERRHLYSLAGVAWRLDGAELRREVDPALLRLMESWERSGAFVLDPILDISAMNSLAVALFEPFGDTTNLVEMVFCDPTAREFFVDWEESAKSTVASLRATAKFSSTPHRFTDLIARLEAASPRFCELWARHEVQPKTHEVKQLRHSTAGELTIEFHAFGVPSAPGHQLLVYQVEPGSLGETRLLDLVAHRIDAVEHGPHPAGDEDQPATSVD
ncbi:helix-turn-helix transcriptional regulator [Rhodococcus sp. JS3073]|uniref:helix-turn-helix transcriptional regulator n=1 Tax=Rhodococcus sp. JS3073 TaxID=3002901 RepID=UPI002285454D|nr:helix-turn-helix transcriptional regulator [Rhodococcus sp. JS3073]WAM14774.1 helix-turn-helix transcriptional regulator [Rhodococcus sp. JS3073]